MQQFEDIVLTKCLAYAQAEDTNVLSMFEKVLSLSRKADLRVEIEANYKEMGNEIKAYYIRNNEGQADPLVYVKEAGMLNMLVFGTTQREQRNIATEDQLALMNELQLYNIYLLENNYPLQDRKKMLFNRKNEFLSRKSRKTLGK